MGVKGWGVERGGRLLVIDGNIQGVVIEIKALHMKHSRVLKQHFLYIDYYLYNIIVLLCTACYYFCVVKKILICD